jgi:hypothetical protein
MPEASRKAADTAPRSAGWLERRATVPDRTAVEADCNFLLSVVVGVLTDQHGFHRGLAGADHRVFERGARSGGQSVPGVPKVVEPEALGYPDVLSRPPPRPPEGAG